MNRPKKYCDWCGYQTGARIHGMCMPRPDYHHADAYHAWMNDPQRPTRNASTTRVLSPHEQAQVLAVQEGERYYFKD
jgi:hypothetical protein